MLLVLLVATVLLRVSCSISLSLLDTLCATHRTLTFFSKLVG